MTEENIRQYPVGATIQLSAMVRDQGRLLEDLRQRDERNQSRITALEASNEILNRTIQTRVNKTLQNRNRSTTLKSTEEPKVNRSDNGQDIWRMHWTESDREHA